MKAKCVLLVLGLLVEFGWASTACAGYTTIDIGSYVNSNVAINANTLPTGSSTGNKGLGIPFLIGTYGGYAGTWNPDWTSGCNGDLNCNTAGISLTVDLTSFNITGQTSFYALLNNYFGTPGANEYNITIKTTGGNSVTYQSIGGVDTRDYNQNSSTTNTIANTTTEWFTNGIGQRLDVREFTLPTDFASKTISSFTISQVTTHDAALFSGLTFSTEAAINLVPEPATALLFGVGVLGLGWSRRRARITRPAD